MVKFAHMADAHLGGWKQGPLMELNMNSFRQAIDESIKEKVDFVIIAGDLFDSAYPPIEILKDTFAEFKKLNQAKIPCFFIAGSHDYSVSGKTFLDVLEQTGFCKNVESWEEKDGKIVLNPTIHKGFAIYGYPGRRSGLEVEDLRKVTFQKSPGMFNLFMLHTTIDKVKGNLPIDAIETDKLPEADYYALGHIHIDFQYENFVYPGPIFPNNFQELEDLTRGGFYIVDTENKPSMKKIDLDSKEVVPLTVIVDNGSTATDKIISEISKKDINDKIILLRVKGILENGSQSDIKFQKVEEFIKSKNAYFMLKNTHELKIKETELAEVSEDSENIEEDTIDDYSQENPSDFNSLIPLLINSLGIEKQEDEKSVIFENRLLEEARKILKF